VKHGSVYANLPEVDEVFTIGMTRAVAVRATKLAGRGGRGGAAAQPLRDLGVHPDGGAILVMPGRYGPYVKWEKINATLPKDTQPEDLTLESALELIADKAAKSGKGKAKAPRKAAAKSTAKATRTGEKPAAKAPRKTAAKTAKAPAKKAATGSKKAG